MASGHANRIKRPDTWLHRPMLQNVKKALANPEPSTHGQRSCEPHQKAGHMAAPTNAAKREKSSCQPGAVHT